MTGAPSNADARIPVEQWHGMVALPMPCSIGFHTACRIAFKGETKRKEKAPKNAD